MARKRRKKYKKCLTPPDDVVIGVAWYELEQWEKLRLVAADPNLLEETYEEWVAMAENSLLKMTTTRVTLTRIFINTDKLVKWCEEQSVPINSSARARYAAMKLQELHEDDRI